MTVPPLPFLPPVLSMNLLQPIRLGTILLICGIVNSGATPTFHDADVGGTVGAKLPGKVECRFSDYRIVIDGLDDELPWRHAQTIEGFSDPSGHQLASGGGSVARARLLWDREYFFFYVEIKGPHLSANKQQSEAGELREDAFTIILKPSGERPGFFQFRIKTAGKGVGRFHVSREETNKVSGDFHFDVAVKEKRASGPREKQTATWSFEGRVPWVDFLRAGGRPNPGETWQIAMWCGDLYRTARHPDASFPASSRDVYRNEEMFRITFVGMDAKTAAKPMGLQGPLPIVPSRVIGSPEPPAPYRARRLYPNYYPSFPIMVKPIPGSDQLLVITEHSPYGVSALVRVPDHPTITERDVKKVLDWDGVAYDLAFHPRFTENGFVYVGWNGPVDAKKARPHTRVTRYRMETKSPYRIDPTSAETIIEWESNGHNGGALCFCKEGMLYVTSGDGTSDSDTNLMGQRPDSLLAKVLRVNVDRVEAGKQYSVPPDNPFVKDVRFRPETWAYGLRNPWRITHDPESGQLWVGNNGQDQWEQAYLVRPGDNYGWSVMEGSHPFYPGRDKGPTAITLPTVEHSHAEFRSLTGGIVYRGKALPELRGAYVYGDYSTGRIWAARHDGNRLVWHREIARTTLRITGFSVDLHGELLICDHQPGGQGGLYTLEPTQPGTHPSTFPMALSDSGLFLSVRDHQMAPGVLPYSVNAPFWSDGLHKERYLVLPPGGKIGYTHTRGWNFPDRTVIVKSFAYEREAGNPASRQWVETRFFTKQDGEWFGYSYAWNEEQTDAVLVGSGGMDRDLIQRIPATADRSAGLRTQRWHFPSRAECMVCHTRASNFVLGLSELQMNREQEYPGGLRDNQLRVLEHLNLFEYDWQSEALAILHKRAAEKGLKDRAANEYVQAHLLPKEQGKSRPSPLLNKTPAFLSALVNPYDSAANLDRRARAWLHANCSTCHVEAGGGNAQMELEMTTPLEKMRVLDVTPLHDTYGIPDAKLVAAGDPERSVLLHRAGLRGRGQMPPLSSCHVDSEGVELLRAWIKSLKR